MGQYLSIGLFIQFTINKKKTEKLNLTVEEVIHQAEQQKVLCKELYLRSDTDDYVLLTLHPELIRQNLLPFLKDFYRIRYPANSCDYESVAALSKLSESDPEEWLEIAKQKRYQTFQTDYSQNIYVKVNHTSQTMIIQGTPIMLSVDGKIMMECYDELFLFFSDCIQERLKDHPLSKAIGVYISE